MCLWILPGRHERAVVAAVMVGGRQVWRLKVGRTLEAAGQPGCGQAHGLRSSREKILQELCRWLESQTP